LNNNDEYLHPDQLVREILQNSLQLSLSDFDKYIRTIQIPLEVGKAIKHVFKKLKSA